MRNPMKIENREITLAILGLLLLLAAVGCARRDAMSEKAAKEIAVQVGAGEVVCVGLHRIESGVAFTGDLDPVETVQITARFEGDLDNVMAREGQQVRRGQALAMYRPRDLNDRLTAAEANLLAAQAGLAAAENGARRARKLFDAGAASSSDLEVAESQRSAAQAALDNATAMRNRAEDDTERLDVPSPISGWVSKVMVHAGDRTAIGDPLFTIVDNSTLELSATVPAEALSRVQPGATIRFHVDGYPNELFEGKVDRINPTTEPGTRQVRIYMRLPNPEGRLVSGLFASGRVVDQIREQVTAAPIAAIRKEGQADVVYRLRGGRAQRLPVRTGLIDEDSGVAEIIGDITVGDSLLTGVLPGLKDGARVMILQGSKTNGSAPAQTER